MLRTLTHAFQGVKNSAEADTAGARLLGTFQLWVKRGGAMLSRFRTPVFPTAKRFRRSSHSTDLTFPRSCAGERHPQRHKALRSSWTTLMRQREPGSTGFYTTCLRIRVICPREWTNRKRLLPEHCKDATTFARSVWRSMFPRGKPQDTVSSCMLDIKPDLKAGATKPDLERAKGHILGEVSLWGARPLSRDVSTRAPAHVRTQCVFAGPIKKGGPTLVVYPTLDSCQRNFLAVR